ncbi:MAG TPA: putative glycoside hydrolase [Gammaproteobacteria bacterium]|nr:putative glycoside hydrolase [Gammaproteobacteria bacterium]
MLAQRYVTMLVIMLSCNVVLAANAEQKSSSNNYELYHRARFSSPVKGIYISQSTLEDRKYLEYLIYRSKQAGINTFVVDLNHVTSRYEKNILLVKNAGLTYVARIVVFPFGSDRHKMHSEAYWMSRYRLVDAAIDLGAEEIQLDYIRYAASNPASSNNSDDVRRVISWFKEKIGYRAKLQIDVFGESCFKESMHIGQNIVKFASTVDAVCPMLYPSHFEPYREHAKRPYNIYFSALEALKSKFSDNQTPFQLYPYIELSNYRHRFSEEQLVGYIQAQIKAVEDADADGWYAWSANNKYDRLFNILSEHN